MTVYTTRNLDGTVKIITVLSKDRKVNYTYTQMEEQTWLLWPDRRGK